jgi:hypothetical protein
MQGNSGASSRFDRFIRGGDPARGGGLGVGGIISIILGLVMIVGGLTGTLTLRGTQSGTGLAVVGAVVLVVRFAKRNG